MVSEAAPNVLLVDDTAENLRLLAGMLSSRGFDVRPVTSGAEALEAVATEPPDLILLDVTMPGMNGFEVCSRLQANEEWRKIPVIFLTALTDVSDKVTGFAAGGVDYITKPFQLEEVIARVTSQLALRSARRELERTILKLREVEQLRDDLVGMIVHDMRSPLTVLITQLQLLRMDLSDELALTVDDALRGARQLNDLANALLDVRRMEEGKMPLGRKRVDLSRLVTEVRDAMTTIEPDRVIEIAELGPTIVDADESLLRRVIENLVSNGIKHTPGSAPVRIEVGSVNGSVRLAVHDQGPGVPYTARERIFEKFGAVAVRLDKSYHSVGLGLAFCKLAVEAHGGTIWVEDGSPRGSVFVVQLPA
ncbi:MAG: response regulator [Gemmatimonadales bacterium]